MTGTADQVLLNNSDQGIKHSKKIRFLFKLKQNINKKAIKKMRVYNNNNNGCCAR